jgi:hypothetical protein
MDDFPDDCMCDDCGEWIRECRCDSQPTKRLALTCVSCGKETHLLIRSECRSCYKPFKEIKRG